MLNKLLVFVLTSVMFPALSWAACPAFTGSGTSGDPYTTTAADASQAEVQACADLVNGEAGYVVINIPAGTVNYTDRAVFDLTEAHYHNVTNLTITGAGAATTVITNNLSSTSDGYAPIAVYIAHSTQFVTVKNIGITQGTGACGKGQIYINGYLTAGHKGYRITGCTITNTTGTGIYKTGNIYGLIDDNTFTFADGRGIALIHSGATAWAETLTFGTANSGLAQYVEGNTFTFASSGDGAIDTYNGEKAVIRYNTITGTHLANLHGYDSGGYRSTFSLEIYNNSMDSNGSGYAAAIATRGGSGIFFNNDIVGDYQKFGVHENYRSKPDYYGTHTGANDSATLTDANVTTNCAPNGFDSAVANDDSYPPYCSGARTVSNSLYVCNQTKQVCAQVTGHTNTTISAAGMDWDTGDVYAVLYFNHLACDGLADTEDGAGTYGYPCKDQVGRTTNQNAFGMFQWDNTFGGAAANWTIASTAFLESDAIQLNRDVFNREPSASDDGWSYYSGYSTYTCPHPLTGLTTSCTSETGTTGYNVSTVRTVTPSATNCTVSPSTAQTVTDGNTLAFTMTAAYGYTASGGGTCGGSLSSGTYTTSAISADCTVTCTGLPKRGVLGGTGTVSIGGIGSSNPSIGAYQ